LILLAFLLPFSLYLLFLGILNRRPHPVLIPGTWDFVGILFAASGFLIVVGPAIISSGSESWRMFWLFGARGGVPAVTEEASQLWSLLAALYFAVVVGGAAYLLRRRRGQTAVYNVDSEAFEKLLAQAFASRRLEPQRSGNHYRFSPGSPLTPEQSNDPAAQRTTGSTDLEVDSFGAMRHVTLRWEPADAGVRREVETELHRTLGQISSSSRLPGDWLVLIALALITFNLFATFGLTVSNLLRR
jgi:hypothetical protein